MPRRKEENRVYFGEVGDPMLHQLYGATGTFTMCSEGGDMHTMCAAIDYLRATPCVVRVTGACMSAAVAILAVGRRRISTPLTRFMVHQATLQKDSKDTVGDLRQDADELEWLENLYFTILGDHTKLTAKEWAGRAKTGHYFSPTEALEYGLIDKISE